MLETQIAQQANSSTTPPGRLPSKLEQNPREQHNAIVLRSGTQIEGHKGVSDEVGSQKEQGKAVAPLPSGSEPQDKRESEKPKELKTLHPKPYMPSLPFSQRFAKAKLDAQFDKFLDMFKRLHVNVPLLDILSQIPLYATFLKEILSKKRKID